MARTERRDLGRSRQSGGEQVGTDHTSRDSHGDGALNLVSKLADVTRPLEGVEQVQRFLTQPYARLSKPLGRIAHEERAEMGNLLAPLAERRHMDTNHRQ